MSLTFFILPSSGSSPLPLQLGQHGTYAFIYRTFVWLHRQESNLRPRLKSLYAGAGELTAYSVFTINLLEGFINVFVSSY